MFWVDATNKGTIEHSYKSIASRLTSTPSETLTLEIALQRLEFYRGSYLLLFDGADDLETLSGLWPPGTVGDILYTSRNAMLRRLPESQKRRIWEMDVEQATELLLKSAHLDDSTQAYKYPAIAIVKELGCLALAVDQAGAYIASGECYIDDFLETFNVHRKRLLENEAYKGAVTSERAVYATWDLSYAAIVRRAEISANDILYQDARAALHVLQIFPFFHNEGIPEKLFKLAAENEDSSIKAKWLSGEHPLAYLLQLRPNGAWESHPFRQGIQILLSFSLISRDGSQQRFLMHRLVHQWAYDRLSTAEQEDCGAQAYQILTHSINLDTEAANHAFRRDLFPHIIAIKQRRHLYSSQNEWWGALKIARIFQEIGSYGEAEVLQLLVVEDLKNSLGEKGLATLTSMNGLAITYLAQGQYAKSEDLLVSVIEERKAVLGEDHPETLKSMHDLAMAYGIQDRLDEAVKIQKQVLETEKIVLGENATETLRSMNSLALIYQKQRRWSEAEELAKTASEKTRQMLGEEDLKFLDSLHSLALLAYYQSRLLEAENLVTELLMKRERILGEKHPSTLWSKGFLGCILHRQGRGVDAKRVQSEVVEGMKVVNGEENPDTLFYMHILALILDSDGESREAIALMRRCYQSQVRVLGPDHLDTRKSFEVLTAWEQSTKHA